MIYNDEPYDGCNPDIKKVSEREMIVLLKILNDHRNELKIKKKN